MADWQLADRLLTFCTRWVATRTVSTTTKLTVRGGTLTHQGQVSSGDNVNAVSAALIRCFSSTRFDGYLAAAGGEVEAAVALYLWNTQASGALWETIGHLEVVLRNALADRPTLWTALAGGFPHAPNRARRTIEQPVERLHALRNRLAHHERIWTEPLSARYADVLTVLAYIDPDVSAWVDQTSRAPALLATCPIARPFP